MYDFKARFYDPAIGRFISPDSIIPGAENPLAWDRYAYSGNNPLKYTDPSGHWPEFNWNFDAHSSAQSFTQSALDITGLASMGFTTTDAANVLSTTACVLDAGVMGLDEISVGLVIIGTTTFSPAVTPVGAYLASEEAVTPLMQMGNIMATEATCISTLSDIIKGDTNITLQVQNDGKDISLSGNYQISSSGVKGLALTGLGWIMPTAETSFVVQAASVLNDIGVWNIWDTRLSGNIDYTTKKKEPIEKE